MILRPILPQVKILLKNVCVMLFTHLLKIKTSDETVNLVEMLTSPSEKYIVLMTVRAY